MTILVRAEAHVPGPRLNEFHEIAARLAATAATEPGTVQYRWFASHDPSVFVVIEEYADEEAAFTHNRDCAALLERFAQVGELIRIQVHGPLGPELSRWINDRPEAYAFTPLAG